MKELRIYFYIAYIDWKMQRKTRTKQIIVFIFIAFLFLSYFLAFPGHRTYDDMEYARLAADFLNGSVDFNNHFTYRWTIILATTFSYLLFGINDFASALPSIICSSIVLVLIARLLRKESLLRLIFALSLTVFSSWYLYYSDKLMADIYLCLFLFSGLYFYHQAKWSLRKDRWIYPFFFVLSLFLAYVSKATIVLIVPLLLLLFVLDVKKGNYRFWKRSSLFGFAILGTYFFIIYLLTGNAFQRFESIFQNEYLNACSYAQQPVEVMLNRIFKDFFDLSVYQDIFLGFILIVPFFWNLKKHFKIRESISFWVISSVVLFLSSNFMTISPTSYSPLCLDPRHYLFLVPIVAIPASKMLEAFFKTQANSRIILITTVLITSYSFFLEGDLFTRKYLPICITFALVLFFGKNMKVRKIAMVLFLTVFLIQPYYNFQFSKQLKYKAQKEFVQKHVLTRTDDCLIVTNRAQKYISRYYNEFKANNLQFEDYRNFVPDSLETRKVLLLKNPRTLYVAGIQENDLPKFVRKDYKAEKRVAEDEDLEIQLIELQPSDLFIEEEREFEFIFTNDFEDQKKYWHWDKLQLDSLVVKQGHFSNRPDVFSMAFKYPIKELLLNEISSLDFDIYFDFISKETTQAKLVVSVEREGESLVWNSYSIQEKVDAVFNWKRINSKASLDYSDAFENAELKIYILNERNEEMYIDNFEIRISGYQEY